MIAAIYARKSTEQTGVADHEKSVTRQIDHATDYAAGKGWTVAQDHIYSDDGISGAEFANRPGFLRLMNALTPTPPFQVLIMSEESRLGREAIETAYALKQLVTAGVRVFFYLEDRERTLDSPTDKIMLSLTAYADELEREKARQRTYDAMVRKAKAGHVTGGRVFGYDNVEVMGEPDAQGRRRRRHVERRINETEADVVRRIFDLSGSGLGMTRIAKCLNADATPAPRPQQGRPRGWVASSVRQMLYRSLYRGEIVWNKTKKRNAWGQAQVSKRPDTEWITVPAPHLRIVSEDAVDPCPCPAVGTPPTGDGLEVSAAGLRALWGLRRRDVRLQPSPGTSPRLLLRVHRPPQAWPIGVRQCVEGPHGGRGHGDLGSHRERRAQTRGRRRRPHACRGGAPPERRGARPRADRRDNGIGDRRGPGPTAHRGDQRERPLPCPARRAPDDGNATGGARANTRHAGAAATTHRPRRAEPPA